MLKYAAVLPSFPPCFLRATDAGLPTLRPTTEQFATDPKPAPLLYCSPYARRHSPVVCVCARALSRAQPLHGKHVVSPDVASVVLMRPQCGEARFHPRVPGFRDTARWKRKERGNGSDRERDKSMYLLIKSTVREGEKDERIRRARSTYTRTKPTGKLGTHPHAHAHARTVPHTCAHGQL